MQKLPTTVAHPPGTELLFNAFLKTSFITINALTRCLNKNALVCGLVLLKTRSSNLKGAVQ